jgi:hypothetical protein
MQYYVVVSKASQLMQYYVIARQASLIDAALCRLCIRRLLRCSTSFDCTQGVSLQTQHFEVAELCRRKAERLTHLIIYTSLYNIM